MKYLFLLLLSVSAFGQAVQIKVDPRKPVFKESYEIKFVVQLESDQEPQISFTPINVEVLNKAQTGTSTNATFINGQASITKTITYVYEVVSNRFGTAYIKDIKVDTGKRVITHPTVQISVLQKAKTQKGIFVRAEIDKEEAFVGESILVRYYLYNAADRPINSTDIKKFPRLDKFLKRFHQEQMTSERVRVNNRMYVRRVLYTAQVFAEKPGEYVIDPISLKVGYSARGNRMNNFGFNLALGRQKRTTVSSERIPITVKPLPMEGMPAEFTGLVGEHKFDIKLNKNKFIVNEPIEIKLNVSGEGALELFDPPNILGLQEVEEFDKKTDLEVRKDFTGLKKVEYTYLARESLDLKGHQAKFAYFDPNQLKYITVELPLGDILISGTSTRMNSSNKPRLKDPENPINNQYPLAVPEEEFNLNPFYKPLNTVLFNAKELSLAFSAVIVIILFFMIREFSRMWRRRTAHLEIFRDIYKNGVSYHKFIEVMDKIGVEGDIRDKIERLDISTKNKEYLLSLLDDLNTVYAEDKTSRLKVKRKFFRDLEKLTKRHNEVTYEL